MKKIIPLFIFVMFFIKVPAQESLSKESQRLMTLFQKLEGTYQLQVINSRDKTEIPLYLMDTIQIKRHISDIVYYPVKNNIRIMILPFATINGANFKPIKRIAYISSEK